ncbi:MAG: phosphate/phosphite/phosphonate ABC transporter substrate-binding protein [Thiogranum sp.]
MRRTDLRRYLAGTVATALLLLTATPAIAGDDSLTFGVFPYLPTARMEQIFAPIAARFGELTGRPIVLRSRPDYGRFREQVKQQAYDILFIQPFDYIRVGAPNGYIPLARWVATDDSDDRGDLSAIMVARPDTGIENLQDVQDRAVAVPNLDAAVSLLGRYTLRNQGVNAHIQSAGNHLACLQQVQVKRAAAGITAWPPVKLFEHKNGVKFKLVYQTRTIPSSLFAVHRRVPAEQRKLLQKELLSWRESDPASAAYLSEGAWTRLYPASDRDYDIVRDIWKQVGTGTP